MPEPQWTCGSGYFLLPKLHKNCTKKVTKLRTHETGEFFSNLFPPLLSHVQIDQSRCPAPAVAQPVRNLL